MGQLGHLIVFGSKVFLEYQIKDFFFSCVEHKEAVISGWVGSREREEVFHTGHYLKKYRCCYFPFWACLKQLKALMKLTFLVAWNFFFFLTLCGPKSNSKYHCFYLFFTDVVKCMETLEPSILLDGGFLGPINFISEYYSNILRNLSAASHYSFGVILFSSVPVNASRSS